MKIINKHFAFTLAEVLITLGIIGVVAAMTIPTLMNQTNDKQTIVALKKAYSELSQAYTLAVNDNGTPDDWGLTADGAGSVKLADMFSQYLKITKNCGLAAGCYPDEVWYLDKSGPVNYNTNTAHAKAQLNDGMIMAFWSGSPNCSLVYGSTQSLSSSCGTIHVDINGFKKPNQWGVDYFQFIVTKYGIIPMGTASQTAGNTFVGQCKDKSASFGLACAAWVIYNENMDYMKCSDLDWNTKTKCN